MFVYGGTWVYHVKIDIWADLFTDLVMPAGRTNVMLNVSVQRVNTTELLLVIVVDLILLVKSTKNTNINFV